ncbi:MAG: YitT family protein [Candidatus Algichlamydia australiensis]|nr:YitT family protein [Chlamydiales bacterium]
MVGTQAVAKTSKQKALTYMWMAIGAFLAALSIRVFLVPNYLIDGGIIGVSLIFGRLFGDGLISPLLIVLNAPFLYLAYKFIRKAFVIQFLIAVLLFALFLSFIELLIPPFIGDPLEVIFFGGVILGMGVGLIIRHGGCLDGTEIMAIIINRKKGFTVGQVVLFINIFVFGAYGLIFQDWHIALRSLMTYVVAFKTMDMVIVGLDEVKSVMVISSNPDKLKKVIMEELGLGLTIMHGKGGYSGDERQILFVIVERLDLSELKEIILREDPSAFMAIQNLHEAVYGKSPVKKKKRSWKLG